MSNSGDPKIAVIGAGASGLLALIELRRAGYTQIEAFEKAEDVGGTWRDNRYPGIACDVPALAYRYSFAPNADWTSQCAPGREIQAYLKRVAAEHGVDRMVTFGQELLSATWDNNGWTLTFTSGPPRRFDVVISATGVLHHAITPDIPGLDCFAGRAFHSSAWPESLAVDGLRVGVIGSGSTSVQIVTATVKSAAHVTMFQRTAQWILPFANPDISDDERARWRADPELLQSEFERLNADATGKFAAAVVGANPGVYAKLDKLCRDNLRDQVADAELRARLTPDYPVGCKRLVMSDGFYAAIQQPNAALVTDRILHVEPEGIRTADGVLHALDILVLATGFDSHAFFKPAKVTGRDGTSLDEAWADGARGYLGVTASALPNWFMIGGPHSPIGNFSWLLTAETQFSYALQLIDIIRAGGARSIAPTAEAVDRFNSELQAKMGDTIWAAGCTNWYIDKTGRVASWPWTYARFQADLRTPNLTEFDIDRA